MPTSVLRSSNPAVTAFEANDPTLSKAFHRGISDEPHKSNWIKQHIAYLESCVSSAVVGVSNSCIIIAGIGGIVLTNDGSLKLHSIFGVDHLYAIVLALGLVILFANGFSMAYVEYLKRREYSDLYNREKRREVWECENYLEGEQKEMVELYQEKGLSRLDATTVVQIFSKDKKFFVDVMMKEELEMMAPNENLHLLVNAFLMAISSMTAGLFPMFPYFGWWAIRHYALPITVTYLHTIYASYLIASIVLFVCGALKSYYNVTKWWVSGLLMLFNGSLVFGISFTAGSSIEQFLL